MAALAEHARRELYAFTRSQGRPITRDEAAAHLGISRKLGAHFALSGSGFRAFRAPTPSELYRSTQVGSKLTLPNSALLSERATGWAEGPCLRSGRTAAAGPVRPARADRCPLGQVEVVPPGQGWSHDPYGAEEQGGAIYGRGAAVTK